MKICIVEGCDRSAETSKSGRRGMCRKHYLEWLAKSDAVDTARPVDTGTEHWLVAFDYPDFLISDNGRVWSIERVDERGQKRGGYFLSPHTYNKTTGHRRVRMNDKLIMLHRLVLSTFVRPPAPGEVCRHLDGDASNNHVSNLSWGTHMDNALDKIRHGTSGRKTVCKRGHPFDEANTYYNRSGHKQCRACNRGRQRPPDYPAKKREQDKRYRERKKAERKAMQGNRKG